MSARIVNWPDVRCWRWEFSAEPTVPERVLIHWACVEDDHIEHDWKKEEVNAILARYGLAK